MLNEPHRKKNFHLHAWGPVEPVVATSSFPSHSWPGLEVHRRSSRNLGKEPQLNHVPVLLYYSCFCEHNVILRLGA